MEALGDDGCVAEEAAAEHAGDARRDPRAAPHHLRRTRALRDGGAVGARAGHSRSLPAPFPQDDFCIANQIS
jgi:hypothetical protein